MNKRIRLPLTVVAVCVGSAAIGALLTHPDPVAAKGPPPRSQFNNQGYWAYFSQDPLGLFFPYGPLPEGSAAHGTDQGSLDVVAAQVSDPADPQMSIAGQTTCLDTYPHGPRITPEFLWDDNDFDSEDPETLELFELCFADSSRAVMRISADGTTVWKVVPGLSKTFRDLDYLLVIEVDWIDIEGGVWDPLAMAPGSSATLYLGRWTLMTRNPKHQDRGCSATGNLKDEGIALSVSRWTLDEQQAQDDCEKK